MPSRWVVHVVALVLALLVAGALIFIARPASGVERERKIVLWYDGDGPDRVLDLRADLVVERTLHDVQYREERTFRGFLLSPVLEAHRRPADDLALLRFDNGMVVPLELDAPSPEIFVALSVWSPGTRRFVPLPPARRRHLIDQDVRPIVFAGNKVVVDGVGRGFSPWRHTSSLVAIEYTTSYAWYAPYAVGSDEWIQRGRAIFEDSCQYCHAIGGHGGTLGWDLLEPLPMTEYRRTPASLKLHVNHRVSNALERGILMPEPRTLSDEEAEALYAWIAAILVERAAVTK